MVGARSTQLANFESDEYSVRVAHSLEEDKELIESGFEYITEREGFKIYRKRKWPLKEILQWVERIEKWAGRDLDSRPFGYQPNALSHAELPARFLGSSMNTFLVY